MGLVKLKKILSKEDNLNVINSIIEQFNMKIAIQDETGVLFGKLEEIKETTKFPITLENKVIGYVVGDNNASCISSVLNHIAADELEKKKLAEETLEKYKEINILYNVSERIASTVGSGNIAKIILGEAVKHVESSVGCIMLYNEERDDFEIICETNKHLQIENGKLQCRISTNSKLVRNSIKKRTGEIINNLKEIDELKEEATSLFSVICNPIIVKSKFMGVMIIGSEEAIEYTAPDLKLCNSLAFQAGVAMESNKLFDSLRENFFDTVQVLVKIIEMRNPFGNGHSQAVMNYSLNIGRMLGLSKMELVKLKLAVLLHDIGNVAISDEILNKRGKLTEEEYDFIKRHSEIGVDMLKDIDQLKDIIPAIRSHHERFDGEGYPDRLKGEDIPLTARIIAVADAFEAMTSDRAYREALNLYFAEEELINNRGAQFDPQVVDAFFKLYKDKNADEIKNYIYDGK
jgi:putative nucleotidyltransferase with HDIG domain